MKPELVCRCIEQKLSSHTCDKCGKPRLDVYDELALLRSALDDIHQYEGTDYSHARTVAHCGLSGEYNAAEGQTRIRFDTYSCGCKYPGGATDRTFEIPCPGCYEASGGLAPE
ncbi:hypothetical protein LCGC14_2393040 [marine sediment metagenome]|uniref:Uncharacterized protein n=1 Tax=marine sediment metagenome TaxID=412755 RepID=A0A0F9BXL6_9ZZZZ